MCEKCSLLKKVIESITNLSKEGICPKRKVAAALIPEDATEIEEIYFGVNYPLGCEEKGCARKDSKSGEDLNKCRGIHAEQNIIYNALLDGVDPLNSTIVITCSPCMECSKMIIALDIGRVVFLEYYPDEEAINLLKEHGVVIQIFENGYLRYLENFLN